jgi:hypothetical protein
VFSVTLFSIPRPWLLGMCAAVQTRATTEGARSIGPAYQVAPPKLQHFRYLRFSLSYRDVEELWA